MGSSPNTEMNNNYGGEEEEHHFSYAMQLVTASALPMVLHSALRPGLLQIINNGAGPGGAHISAAQIASKLDSTNPDAAAMVDRMLRLLASHNVVTCSLEESSGVLTRVYGLAPAGKYFVPNQELGGASLGHLLALNQDKVFIGSWYALEDAVLEGGVPFNKVYGSHVYEYNGKDPIFNNVFNQAMVNLTTITITRILDSYKGFQHLKSLVDVGGSLGLTISRITAKYPTIKGINFDLPHVIKHAPPYPGVQHIGGDMFESVPEADAIFMKWILHNWSDDQCVKLLKNCYNCLPDNGKVIVVDAILPVKPDTSSAIKGICQMDAIMLTQIAGGKERSEQEFLALATAAGFKGIKKECFVCNLWVMEFYKYTTFLFIILHLDLDLSFIGTTLSLL